MVPVLVRMCFNLKEVINYVGTILTFKKTLVKAEKQSTKEIEKED